MTDHLNFNVLNWARLQEARKKAEAEKIQIMEELWQARFGYHRMGFCRVPPILIHHLCITSDE